MTGSGAAIANDGTFAFGNSSKSVVWDGTTLTVNGSIISTGNIADSAVSTAKVDSNAITQSYVARAEIGQNVGAGGGALLSSPTLTVSGFVGGFIQISGNVWLGEGGECWIKKSSGPNGYWWSNPGVQSGTGSLESPRENASLGTTITHYWIPLTEGSLTFVVENQIAGAGDFSYVSGYISILAATFKR
jgi:hypothetical protein